MHFVFMSSHGPIVPKDTSAHDFFPEIECRDGQIGCHLVNKVLLDVWKAGMLGDRALDSTIGHEFGPPILELV